jgi:Tol biopolymer transport system component
MATAHDTSRDRKETALATYQFSALTSLQRLVFDPLVDSIFFDQSATELAIDSVGDAVRLVLGTKTVFLDGIALESLPSATLQFPPGSLLRLGDGTANPYRDAYGLTTTFSDPNVSVHVQALGGADLVSTPGGHDMLVGNGPLVPIVQVSRVGSTGSPNASSDASISADGRFVAFDGGWTGFGSQSNNSTDVFVKDLLGGTVSNEHKTASGDFGLSGSGRPEISADGKWFVFWSNSALVPNAPGSTIYKSAVSGPAVTAVSTTAGDAFANGSTDHPAVSADGRYVAFQSRATNLAPGGEATHDDIFVKDTATGALWRASSSLGGGDANADCRDADISADGRYVVFSSYATNLTANDGSFHADVYLWDRTTQRLINITGGKGGDFDVLNPHVASDGKAGGVVVFETGKSLVAADTNNATDIYAYRIADGSFTRVSTRANGSQVDGSSGSPAVSGDGRFVVFTSGSPQLVDGDENGWDDVFVKDLKTGAIALVSKAAKGKQGNQHSRFSEISLGGDWIVFESGASNLAAGNANGGLNDVFRVSNPLLFDTLRGGAGNDTYVVHRPDVIVEGANAGNDTVKSSISWTLGANLENLVLTGGGAINGTGNELTNRITGNSAKNTLNGYGGNDTLLGGAGSDRLTGGTGQDVIRFDSELNASTNVDRIADFVVKDDTIQLENAVFTSLAAAGPLAAGRLRAGAGVTTAADSNDYLIYNSTTGALYYDADGSGSASSPIPFALLGSGLALTVGDFFII